MANDGEGTGRKSKSRSKSRQRHYHRNPYLNFLTAFRQMPEQQNLSSKMIFKMAGEKWRGLSDVNREPYVQQAQFAKNTVGRVVKRKGGKKKRAANVTRKCSRCGHIYGTPVNVEETLDEDEVSSTSSRSQSKSDSKSGSPSMVDGFFTDDTSTTF